MKYSEQQIRNLTGCKAPIINREVVIDTTVDADCASGSPMDSILHTIYAIDPETGHPANDLSISFSENTRADILDYLNRVLRNPNPHLPGTDDETAFATIVPRTCQSVPELEPYVQRLQEYIAKVQTEPNSVDNVELNS